MISRHFLREPIRVSWKAVSPLFTGRRVLIGLLVLGFLYLSLPFLLILLVGRFT